MHGPETGIIPLRDEIAYDARNHTIEVPAKAEVVGNVASQA